MVSTAELPFITKVLIPRRRDYAVRRDRLLGPMLGRVDKKAQMVCAPAGYGKTGLLVEFAAEVDLPLCWYSFSPEDRDPISFLRYCVHSIRAKYREFGATCISLLRSATNVDQHTLTGLFTTSLHNDLPGRLVFVFDDVHWADGKEELEETLSLLIERAPSNVHFLLGSRTRPSLPCLARLAAQDELDSVDLDDLRFSTEETTQLLAHLWHRPVAADEADEVQARTGGWAAAIMLLAKSHGSADGVQSITAADEGALFDYLTREVFEQLPEPLRVFLLRTSIFLEFTVGICDRLLESSDSGRLISDVKTRSLFLEERVGHGVNYKYHDLFREYLERRLQSHDPDEYKNLHLRAATIYSQLGDDDAAVQHFLHGGEQGRAAAIVREVGDILYDQGRWDKLSSWLGRIPQEVVENDPALILQSAQVSLRLGDPSRSLERLNWLVSGPHGDDREVLGKALVAKSTAYRRLGHLDLAVKAAEEGLTVLRGINCRPEHVADAYKQLGDALTSAGEYDRAERNLRAGLALISKENLRLYSLISNDLGVVYLELGDLDQAAMYLDEARVGLSKLGNQGQLAEALTNLALVYYHKGEFDLALDEVGEALRAAQAGNYPRIVATALMHQGMVQRALGAYTDSISSSSRALELARQNLDQRLIAGSMEGLGTAYRKLGQASKAEVLLNQALLEAEDSGQKYIAAFFHISLGKVHCQLGSHSTALEHLRLAEEQLTGLKSLRRVAEAKLFQAAIYYRTNKLKEAVENLTRVADLVSQLGYDGFLLADGDAVLDVIRFGAARRVGGDTYTRLVARLTRGPSLPEEPDRGLVGHGGFARYPVLRAFSFGHPRVMLDTHEVTDAEWQSRKAKELFFFLCYNNRVLTNEDIIDNLWPEASVDLGSGALRISVFRVRQALFSDCILTNDEGYCLNREILIELDTEQLLRHLDQATDPGQSNESRERHLEKAVALYHGSFLNGIYSDWCQVLRTNLESKYHTALINLAACKARKKNFGRAARLLETVVTTDPYNEEAQYQLIQNLLDTGESVAASQELRKYAKLCREELACDLSPRFARCYRRIAMLQPLGA